MADGLAELVPGFIIGLGAAFVPDCACESTALVSRCLRMCAGIIADAYAYAHAHTHTHTSPARVLCLFHQYEMQCACECMCVLVCLRVCVL